MGVPEGKGGTVVRWPPTDQQSRLSNRPGEAWTNVTVVGAGPASPGAASFGTVLAPDEDPDPPPRFPLEPPLLDPDPGTVPAAPPGEANASAEEFPAHPAIAPAPIAAPASGHKNLSMTDPS